MTVKEFLAKNSVGWVTTRERIPSCGVWLTTGEDVPALAVVQHPSGSWAVLTLDGTARHFSRGEVA